MANKTGFYIGIVFMALAVILLVGNFLGDSTFPILLGGLGILSIGVSNYRPLEAAKEGRNEK